MARLGSGIPLVARREELRTLREALRAARAGKAGGVLLSGDAGVGKSRLLTELLTEAGADGDTVVVGRCLDTAEASLPYLPFAEAVGQLTERHGDSISGYAALRRLLPDRRAPAGTDEDRDLGQLQLFDALHSALAEITADRTVLLSVEDLHWADRSSRDLLAFLLARLAGQRLLIIGTYRTDDLHRRHPLRPLLTELVRLPAVQRLHLEPFGAAEAYHFVGTLADWSLSEEQVAEVAERSEGNPFIAEELLSASSEHVPTELAEILLARLERLSPAAQQAMRLASVLGRRFGHGLLAGAADVPPEELDVSLREAMTHNVLVLEGESYAFRHALLREAVYADLLPGERSRLHAQVARALESDAAPGTAAALAHHSMESHQLTGAFGASVRAAREADEVGAPAEMLVHVERALTLWSAVPDPEQTAGVSEVELTRWAAGAAGASGEPDRAIAHSRTAIELADAHGDVLERAEVRRAYVKYLFTLDGTGEQAYRYAVEAWELVADREPSVVKAWAQAQLARALVSVGRYEEATQVATEAIAGARAVPGEAASAEADALLTRTWLVERKQQPIEAALAYYDEAIALARKAEASSVELRARFNRGMTLLEDGRFDAALADFDSAAERADSTGMRWSAFGLENRVVQVLTRFMVGDWDGAEAAAELAGEAVSGTVLTRVSAAGLLLAVHRGRYDVAERRVSALVQRWQLDSQVMMLVGHGGAELECWRGRPERGAALAEKALHRMQSLVPWALGALSVCAAGIAGYADVAERARRAKDEAALATAVAAGDRLLALAGETVRRGRPQGADLGPEGRAWYARARAEATRLHGTSDVAAWRETAEAFGYGEVYREAQARWRLAEALLARGHRDQAAEALRAAGEVADRLGAVPLAEAVRDLARRSRLGGAAATSPDLLTPREYAVLRLVASGRTNRQIGTELFISEKTVSVHLSRAMSKLGAASRTEAVSAAYARGVLTPTE
ncbi:MAG: helix-turn-helix transcriptional regulator [Micromonosporaceae bacterium]